MFGEGDNMDHKRKGDSSKRFKVSDELNEVAHSVLTVDVNLKAWDLIPLAELTRGS